jgi:acyl transferase domain-containing protein
MGWYVALACAGALAPLDGLRIVNTMGTLMQEALIGGQSVYPFTDEDWREKPGERGRILNAVQAIDARPGHDLSLSIDLGGMLVLAGNAAGLDAFDAQMPRLRDRFPMRLPNHAAFHTVLQAPVAEAGRARLSPDLFRQPGLPLIDGRGAIWSPQAIDLSALWDYTFGHQVVRPYDFTGAIRTAAREFMPDVFIVLGPGTTLGGAVAQSLVRANWRGWTGKADFQAAQGATPRLIAMGMDEQRALAVAA